VKNSLEITQRTNNKRKILNNTVEVGEAEWTKFDKGTI